MLRLPGPDDELPPLVMPARAETSPTGEEEYDDEQEADEVAAAVRSDRTFIAVLALSAVVLLTVFGWWMLSGENSRPPVVVVPPPAADPGTPDVAAPKPLILEIESTVKAFLEAPTKEQALEKVRDAAGTARKWDAWPGGQDYQPPGFRGMVGDPLTTGASEGKVAAVQVRTGDFQLREIAVMKENGRFKIDWDSWAGWSEMTWTDFMREKPAEPKLFRVVLSPVDYYNFSFRDDREWSSYRLDSPDGMETLYGYVTRTGEIDQQVRPLTPGAKTKWLLMLKFPPDATEGNQVLIDRVVAEGWVSDDAAEAGR